MCRKVNGVKFQLIKRFQYIHKRAQELTFRFRQIPKSFTHQILSPFGYKSKQKMRSALRSLRSQLRQFKKNICEKREICCATIQQCKQHLKHGVEKLKWGFEQANKECRAYVQHCHRRVKRTKECFFQEIEKGVQDVRRRLCAQCEAIGKSIKDLNDRFLSCFRRFGQISQRKGFIPKTT